MYKWWIVEHCCATYLCYMGISHKVKMATFVANVWSRLLVVSHVRHTCLPYLGSAVFTHTQLLIAAVQSKIGSCLIISAHSCVTVIVRSCKNNIRGKWCNPDGAITQSSSHPPALPGQCCVYSYTVTAVQSKNLHLYTSVSHYDSYKLAISNIQW